MAKTKTSLLLGLGITGSLIAAYMIMDQAEPGVVASGSMALQQGIGRWRVRMIQADPGHTPTYVGEFLAPSTSPAWTFVPRGPASSPKEAKNLAIEQLYLFGSKVWVMDSGQLGAYEWVVIRSEAEGGDLSYIGGYRPRGDDTSAWVELEADATPPEARASVLEAIEGLADRG